ncbi:hypothetical protein UAJ10_01475 [Nitrospirillum sp. BR 11164]|uniref:hypothetical protein n=1 Tax=Nitrospirillum sp. BR 11164 TaxID=3104324 RepID=UPI002AFE26C2|nr:hypothetical protein [Nitrospirillum sp. BR 11164]MEA1647687.1 hypothetical protein [Nitrospirillum sp. BR 11164]
MRAPLGVLALLTATPAMAAASPQWIANGDKAGIAYDGAGEFSDMALTCEEGPLTLWLEADCGGADTCPVALIVDGRSIPLGVGRYQPDGMSGVLVPMKGRARALDRLAKAHHLRLRVGKTLTSERATAGLEAAIGALRAACLGAQHPTPTA